MAALLRAERLCKAFGRLTLFEIERLQIAEGSSYVLTGANGSGKTTLLRVLGGLEPARADYFEFDGRASPLVPFPKSLRAHIVYVHQHPVLFSTSVMHNVAYGLLARGMPRHEVQQRVEEAMAWAGIAHLRDRPPQRLSGGEKQRVALARAKVLEPRLLLLDEPTANLDGAAREQVLALIPTLQHSGTSAIIACHDRELIALRGMLRIKLREGRLEYRGARSTKLIHAIRSQS